VYDEEGRLALAQILGIACGICHGCGGNVSVLSPDLELPAKKVDQRQEVIILSRAGHHQAHGQPKESAGFITDHLLIIALRGHGKGVTPLQLHTLATVQIWDFFVEYLARLLYSGQRE
jgi:hypothetical protein